LIAIVVVDLLNCSSKKQNKRYLEI
jgi:hypothetical protein